MHRLRHSLETAFRSPAREWIAFVLCVACASVGFRSTLAELARCSARDDLTSHVWLIPVISGWLLVRGRDAFAAPHQAAPGGVAFLIACAAALDAVRRRLSPALPATDGVALGMAAFVLLVAAGFLLAFGRSALRRALFPLAFLLFMMPVPSLAVRAANRFLQQGSADLAYAWISLSGIPAFREGLVFRLPDLTIEVAEECSGIRSSLVLFITSLVAGRLFLESRWRRLVLVLVVIPLGVFRNSLRIFLLAFLAERVGRDVLRSALHRYGGQPFFVLSLVMFLAILIGLRRSELRRAVPQPEERTCA